MLRHCVESQEDMMKLHFHCLANCQINTFTRLMDSFNISSEKQLIVIKEICRYIGELQPDVNSGDAYSEAFNLFRDLIGINDPCTAIKKQNNEQSVIVQKILKNNLKYSDYPLLEAMKAAAAGNLMDVSFGNSFDAEKEIADLLKTDFSIDDTQLFYDMLEKSQQLLLLADNAGEILLDRLMLDELQSWRRRMGYPSIRVVTMVKAVPVLNDAMIEDALFAGMDEIGELIDTGCKYMGTPPGKINKKARITLDNADIIIAKGLANYESLHYLNDIMQEKIFYVFKSKCPLISEKLMVPKDSLVFINGNNKLNFN